MQMTAADIAFMKGEAAAADAAQGINALDSAATHGYVVPGPQRDAFVSGFLGVRADSPAS